MKFVFNDGGRAAAGWNEHSQDCVTRSIAVATRRPYKQVFTELLSRAPRKSPILGVHTETKWFRKYMTEAGWRWIELRRRRKKTFMRADQLPRRRLIVAVSRHYTAVINHAVHDDHDPTRNGTRHVHGYWIKDSRK